MSNDKTICKQQWQTLGAKWQENNQLLSACILIWQGKKHKQKWNEWQRKYNVLGLSYNVLHTKVNDHKAIPVCLNQHGWESQVGVMERVELE